MVSGVVAVAGLTWTANLDIGPNSIVALFAIADLHVVCFCQIAMNSLHKPILGEQRFTKA